MGQLRHKALGLFQVLLHIIGGIDRSRLVGPEVCQHVVGVDENEVARHFGHLIRIEDAEPWDPAIVSVRN